MENLEAQIKESIQSSLKKDRVMNANLVALSNILFRFQQNLNDSQVFVNKMNKVYV